MIRVYLVLVVLAVTVANASAAFQCIYCSTGKYKSVVANDACVSCPANRYMNYSGADDENDCYRCVTNSSSNSGSTSITDCRCNPGFYGPLGGPCTPCAKATYANNSGQSACSLCPSNADSDLQSDALTDCACVAGYTGANGGTCTACAANTYKTTTGAHVCTNCVTNTMTIGNANTNENACICTAGHTGGGGFVTCSGCVAGKYKGITGSVACTNCTVDTYSMALAATSSATCALCPSNTVSFVGSSVLQACTCNTGYTSPSGDGYACAACVVGQYKTATGSAACTNCGYGKYSAAVAAKVSSTCLSCPDVNSYTATVGNDVLADCECNAGYTGNNGEYCAACVRGKYKMITGPATCISCVANTYSTVLASITGANCTSCPTSSQSPSSSSALAACICNMGYTGAGGSETLPYIAAATFTDLTSSCGLNMNEKCGCASSDVYSDRSCVKAIDDINTDASLFMVLGNVCAGNCAFGSSSIQPYIKIDFGQAVDVTSVTFVARTEWAPNDFDIFIGNSNVMQSNTLCATNLFFGTSAEYTAKSFGCVGRGQYIFIRQGSSFSGNYMQFREMQVAGSIPEKNRPCAACVAGTFKPTNGSALCTECVANTYSTAVAAIINTCVGCPVYMQSAVASDYITDCKCNAGYTGLDGAMCTGCAAGKYKTTVGTNLCTNCAADTFSTQVNKSDSVCETCVFYTTGPSQSPVGSDDRTDCQCNKGYTGPHGQTCAGCVAGKYKTAAGSEICSSCLPDTYQTLPAKFLQSDCLDCPAASTSLSASPTLASCQCVPGFSGANGGPCTQCYAGQFKPFKGPDACSVCPNATWSSQFAATSSGTCVPCQAFSLSRAGSTAHTDCKCDKGYFTKDMFQMNVSCSRCTPGTYNSELHAIACSKCTAGQYSTNFTATSRETCQTCMVGYSAEGQSQCDMCPENAIALPGSGLLEDCKCVPGYTGPNGGTCQYCIAGKFKTNNGSALCTNCPVDTFSEETALILQSDCVDCYSNSESASGSNSFDNCKCSVGYTSSVAGQDGQQCEPCGLGLYKNTTGHAACSPCPTNTYRDVTTSISINNCTQCFLHSISAAGSDALDDCLCVGGFERASV